MTTASAQNGVRVESLAIGDELLRGETIDSNASYLGAALLRSGLRLSCSTVLPDDEEVIVARLREALGRADVLVVSGGLGPTIDDRTAAAAARAFDAPLQLHAPTLERIREIFASRGYTLTPNNEKQALVPLGAEVLTNPVGTAPAFTLEASGTRVFFLPGVPREYHTLVDQEVLPRIAALRSGVVARARVLHTIGATESKVDQLLRSAELHGARLSTRVEGPETHVILVAEAAAAEGAERALAAAEESARAALGALVYGADDATLASTLGERLVERGFSIAVAESCTGGLVGGELTAVPGASRYFKTGIVAYANETKTALLGVDPEILRVHGAVSEEVARAMARGIRERAGADLGLAVTGIAGPTGGSADKPVGLVHFAASGPRELHRRVIFPGGRERVRHYAARVALAVALEAVRP